MSIDVERDPVRVNKLLGERASIGPIPAEQLLPWVAIGGVSFFIVRMLLAQSFMVWILCWIWLNGTWWVLTGEKTYQFIKSWATPPGWDWTNGETLFIRAHEDTVMWTKFQNFLKKDQKIKRETQQGEKTFASFQNLCHLHSIVQVELGGHKFACLLLYDAGKDQWSAEIPFKLQGLHPQLYRSEVEDAIGSHSAGHGGTARWRAITVPYRMPILHPGPQRAASQTGPHLSRAPGFGDAIGRGSPH
jgi:hypothetical protein